MLCAISTFYLLTYSTCLMILTFIYVYTSLTVFILIKTFNQSYL